ncbi:unnamed protein product, partial [Lymnaea stagnalis]
CQGCAVQFLAQSKAHVSNDLLLCSDFRIMESCLGTATDCATDFKQALIDQNKVLINFNACAEITTTAPTTTTTTTPTTNTTATPTTTTTTTPTTTTTTTPTTTTTTTETTTPTKKVEITTTAVTRWSTTTNVCTTTMDQCALTFLMISTQRGPNAELVCGDLSDLEKCIFNSNCGNSDAEKENVIAQTKSDLTTRGITCGLPTTTKSPVTTPTPVKECSTAADQCVMTFLMMSTQHGPNPDLVCGDQSTFEKCILDLNCGLTNAEKDSIITTNKNGLQARGVTCGPTTTKTPLTTKSSVKVCTTTMDQCALTFLMISTQRGPNAELVCGDLSDLEKCIFNSNCGNSDAEKENVIAQTKSDLTTRGITCGLPTTTKSPVTTPTPVKGCATTVEQCVINFAIVSTPYGSNADPVCRELRTMEKCVLDTNCGTSSSDKEIIITQTRNQLKNNGISCDGAITTTAIPVTTTKTACKTLVDNCVFSFVVASASHTTDADLTCRDFSTMEKCIAAVCDSPDAEKSAARNQIKTQLQQKYNISCVYGATYPTTKSPITSPTTVKLVTTAIPTNTKTTDRECLDTVDNCVFNFMIISTSHGPNPTLVCGDLLVMETCIMETNCGMPDTEKRSVIDQNTNKLAARGVMCGTMTTKIPVQTTEKSCSPDQCMNTFLQSLSDHNGMQERMCGDLSILENCLNLNCGLSEAHKNSFIVQSTQLLEFQGVKCDCSSKVLKCQNEFIKNYTASNSNEHLICSHQRTFEKCIQALDCVSASNKTLLIERNKRNIEDKGIMCDCVNGFSQCEESYQNAAFTKPITKPLLCTHIQTFMKCIFDLSSCDLSNAFKDNLLKETKEQLDARRVPCDLYKVIYGTNEPGSDGPNSGLKLTLQVSVYFLAAMFAIMFKL